MWLREVLSEAKLIGPDQAVGTHSAKATTLSWMCKAHAPGDLQRLAGYHVDANSKSALEYSRDAQAPVMHFIEGMVLAIFSGMFMPDLTRAGRWNGCRSLEQALDILARRTGREAWESEWHGVEQSDGEQSACFSDPYDFAHADGNKDGAPRLETVGSDASDEDRDVLHDHEQDERQMEVTGRAISGLVSGAGPNVARVFRHKVSGIFHLMSDREDVPDDDGELSCTKCGKLISHNFEEIDQWESFLPVKCKRCFT